MEERRIGRQSLVFEHPVTIVSNATVVGKHEGEGPLGPKYDVIKPDSMMGQQSFEKAETAMLEECARLALSHGGFEPTDIDLFLAGDLLNQLVSTNYAARGLSIPFWGLYGACSTFCEALSIGAVMVDGGYTRRALVGACSHHETAERQYRYPTEFGGQRTPTAQWTVTGAGCAVLERADAQPIITHATIGSVYDLGVTDADNMGGAMAPAAAETISAHLEDTGRDCEFYDLIVTGDLGKVGHAVLAELLKKKGIEIAADRLTDCGLMVYSDRQDKHAGGSGCGCASVVFLAEILPKLKDGELSRVLLVATGALHSPCTVQQGESIPAIAHAVAFESAIR